MNDGVQYVDVMFGPYLPDLGGAPSAETPGYLTDAVGVRSTPRGYRGAPAFADVPSAAAIGGATNHFWQGIYVESSTTGNHFVFHVDDAKIYESQDDGQSWSDTTPAAGAAPTFPGHFFTYKSDIIFVCGARAPISRLISAAAGTDFANLAGSPPTALCGAQVYQHVVLASLVGVDNYALQTSAIGTDTDWPTPGTDDARSKQSIREPLPQACGIPRFIGSREKIGIVFQEKGLTRMTYEGGDTVYAFDTYSTEIGVGYNRYTRPISDGVRWYWYNDHGYFATDGYSVERLDDGKIEDAIFSDLVSHPNASTLSPTFPSIGYDPHRHLLIAGNHEQDYQLCYDVSSGDFNWLNESNLTSPYSGRYFGSAPPSKRTYGRIVYNVNQSNRKLQYLSSSSATVAMQTGYIEVDPGFEVQLEGVHLLGSGVPGSVAIQYKAAAALANCDVAQSGFTNLQANSRGEKSAARVTSQYFAFRIAGTGSESQLLRGLRIYYSRGAPAQ